MYLSYISLIEEKQEHSDCKSGSSFRQECIQPPESLPEGQENKKNQGRLQVHKKGEKLKKMKEKRK